MIIRFIELASMSRNCGYCGWENDNHEPHNCDGFGHSAGYDQDDNLVMESGNCLDCQRGFCEKSEWLRQAVERKTGLQVVNVAPLVSVDFNSGLRSMPRPERPARPGSRPIRLPRATQQATIPLSKWN